uniref:Uncharacterized protein n=1 Tax=Noccaea caerulescens TaxID=107243 RepID=A0A1J3F8L0_NOCCA
MARAIEFVRSFSSSNLLSSILSLSLQLISTNKILISALEVHEQVKDNGEKAFRVFGEESECERVRREKRVTLHEFDSSQPQLQSDMS